MRALTDQPPASSRLCRLMMELQLDGIGVSLIDSEPRELLHASLEHLKVVAVR